MNIPVDISDVVLKTEHLTLRPWREEDLADFYEYASVDGVGQMAGWNPHRSIEESREILTHFIKGKRVFALEYRGKVVGSLGVDPYAENNYPELDALKGCEIGYVLSRDYWGRGLMPEAVKAVIDYCFAQLHFDWLTCGHFIRNNQSRRVVEKCGFQYVKDVIHATRFGTEEPTKLYVLYNPNK